MKICKQMLYHLITTGDDLLPKHALFVNKLKHFFEQIIHLQHDITQSIYWK